jgi:hypothetical protein
VLYTALVQSVAVLAVVAAVLGNGELVLVDTSGTQPARSVPLPGRGVAVFAAPDGRWLVPLEGSDETAVVAAGRVVERWKGRLFPLFFDEPDRLHTVMPGVVATLSYPERVLIGRTPVPALVGARRAACSRDGRVVAAIVPEPAPGSLVLAAAGGLRTSSVLPLQGEATSVTVAPAGQWVAIGLAAGGVGVVAFGAEAFGGTITLAGPVRAVAAAEDGALMLAGVETGAGGTLVGLRVDPAKKQPVVEKFATPVERPIRALASAGEEVVALADGLVLVFDHSGRQLRGRLEVPGAHGVAIAFEKARSIVPQWSEP